MDPDTAAAASAGRSSSPPASPAGTLRRVAIDVVLGLVIGVLALHPPVDVEDASLLVAGLAFLAVATRRLSPAVGLLLGWAMALAQFQQYERPGLADVALLLVLYSTARRGSRPVLLLGAASALVGGSLATLYLQRTGTRFPLLTSPSATGLLVALTPVAILLLAWLSGIVIRALRDRSAESRLRVQAEDTAVRAVDLAQAETLRASMARDVHDVVGHSLAVIIAQADSVPFLDDEERIRAVAATIADTARRSLAEVREVLSGTSPADADDGPEDLDAVVAQVRDAGVDLVHELRGARRPVDAARHVVIRRVAQEMTTNAMRHGTAGGRIRLRETWRTADVVLEVENPVAVGADARADPARAGSGTADAVPLRAGTGLDGMRTRLAAVGGDLDAEAVDDLFTARARIPLPGARPLTVPGGRP
jgi:signal transduction histidine kinase